MLRVRKDKEGMFKKWQLNDLMKKPTVIILAIVSLILIVFLSFFFYFNHYLHTATTNNRTEVEFEITKGQGVRTIAKDLENKGLLEHDLPFLVYLKLTGLSDDLKAGNYVLYRNNTPLEIIDILTKGKVASVKITIPEGWTTNQIDDYLAKKNIVTKDDFLAATKKKYNYDFLKELPEGASVEGFLFPDTYQIPFHSTSEEIVNRMLDNFDKRITPEMRTEISATSLSLYQTITLASIVEKEVTKPEDKKTVAGIFLARLSEGTPLQSDATVDYYLKTNKTVLSNEDVQTPSPYNTYLINGLPYGPISNPGLESIDAVIHPVETDFRYFLTANGQIYYSKTLEEHNTKKEQYLK